VRRLRSPLAVTLMGWLCVASVGQGQPAGLAELKREISARYPAVRWVEAASLARWMAGPEAERPHLLDVRTAEEFAVSHLRGAVRVDPDRPDLGAIPDDERPVVVYCSVGWRSGTLGARLVERGQRRVFNLEGGIFGWANAGRPIWSEGRRASQVHPYDEDWGRLLRTRLRWSAGRD